MSPKSDDESPEDRMFRLERRARVVRSRLLRAVDALDARRRQVAEVGRRTKRAAVPIAASVLGVAVLAGVGAVAFALTVARRRRRSISYRLTSGASHALQRFEAMRQPSLPRRIFDRVMLSIAAIVTGELAKRVTKNAFDGRFADGRLVVGRALARHHHEQLPVPRLLPTDGAARR